MRRTSLELKRVEFMKKPSLVRASVSSDALPVFVGQLLVQRLRQQVAEVVFCRYLDRYDDSVAARAVDRTERDFVLACSFAPRGAVALCLCNGHRSITKHGYWLYRESEFLKKVAHKVDLFDRVRQGAELRFACVHLD